MLTNTPEENNSENSDPRLLILDLSHGFGGASIRGLKLLGHLPKGQAALVGLKDTPVVQRAIDGGLEVHTLYSHKADPRNLFRLVKLIRKQGFEVLNTQNIQSQMWGSLATWITGIAFVAWLGSWYETEHLGSRKGRVYQFIQRITNSRVDRFITDSNEIRRKLVATGIPEEITKTIANAIEVDPSTIDGDRKWLRETYDLPENAIVCSTAGRFVEAKGYEHLIASLDILKRQRPDLPLYCIIIGDGHLRDPMTAQMKRLQVEDRIRMPGFLAPEEVMSIVKVSDLFVMPSLTEGTPNALLEAAALGRPIVASRVGGIPDLVFHEEHALLVEAADERGLADALIYMCDNPKEATRLGTQAQERVCEEFNLDRQVEHAMHEWRAASLGLSHI